MLATCERFDTDVRIEYSAGAPTAFPAEPETVPVDGIEPGPLNFP